MWRLPVTFGGGMTIQNGCAAARSGRPALNAPVRSQTAETRPSTAARSKDLSIIERQVHAAPCRYGSSKFELGLPCPPAPQAPAAGGRDGFKPIAAAQVNARMGSDRLPGSARDPLDFRPHQPLNDAGQMVVEPLFEQRAEHLAHDPVGDLGAAHGETG